MEAGLVKKEYRLSQWSAMVKECRSSGMTIKAWCQANGIGEHAYYYRLKCLREAACEMMEGEQEFAEVPCTAAPSRDQVMKVTFKNAVAEIPLNDRAVVQAVIQVLANAE